MSSRNNLAKRCTAAVSRRLPLAEAPTRELLLYVCGQSKAPARFTWVIETAGAMPEASEA